MDQEFKDKLQFETQAIRTQTKQTPQREHSTPLYLTSSFTFDDAAHGAALFKGQADGNIYSRFSNPNTAEFIDKLCAMEGCDAGIATASGMAAVYATFMAHVKQGDHVVAANDIFGNTKYIITELLPRMGVTFTLVDVDNTEAWERAFTQKTVLAYVESPSNPTLKIADLQHIANLCHAHDALCVVDNCFATPYLQQPALFGTHLVIHSATKYIDGQGRVLGGAIVGDEKPVQRCYDFIRRTGACLSPFNAWILSKSLETLAVRMDRHCASAAKIADYLADHNKVSKVSYPFHKNAPQLDLAKKQQRQGGGLVAFEIHGGLLEGQQFLNNLRIHSLTANLGDSRSIATHPASTTHSKLSAEAQLKSGITPGFIRLSVGLEHVDDLIQDIDQALNYL